MVYSTVHSLDFLAIFFIIIIIFSMVNGHDTSMKTLGMREGVTSQGTLLFKPHIGLDLCNCIDKVYRLGLHHTKIF